VRFQLRRRPLWKKVLRSPLVFWQSYKVTPSVRVAWGTVKVVLCG
jgi:hypothetical protein